MINRISGFLRGKTPSSCFIETNGVEWNIGISAMTFGVLPENDEPCSLLITLIHRDDQMKLFGFATDTEREIFRSLLKVPGIGPKQAIKILSRIRPEELVGILAEGNAEALSGIPGVGPKTCPKIVLTLKGKVELPSVRGGERGSEIVEALCDMGFDRKQAVKAVQTLLSERRPDESGGELTEGEVLRRAIVLLST
jgi:Holliday junction DNA helicase RuvA